MMRVGASVLLASLVAAGAHYARAETPKAANVLADMRAAYATLASYTDEGSAVSEQKPPGATTVRETRTFATRFERPKLFRFETEKDSTGERLAIWSDGNRFSSWWSATKVSETYPPGKGTTAFAVSDFPTAGLCTMIPALLFAGAGLQSPLVTVNAVSETQAERIYGHDVWRVTGEVAVNHWNGELRPIDIWVDQESHLVRQVRIGTGNAASSDAVDRLTAKFEPVANPDLKPDDFAFIPP